MQRFVGLSSTTSAFRPARLEDCEAAVCAARTDSGTNTLNVEPLPNSEVTLIEPPMASTSFLVMARPRPVPP